ncbi:tRNA 2-thiouridine synthesizing protein B [Halalkaliarchaeum desulfuricum]|uniref:tRNA 2-thiouridine synthesizing protein B n=1 Tax=Halalkaliarchaeum desulfuricum TaxID=2055893 RepID=A0A343TLZ6_9EURY|nr:DsrH/TusB family sulfur metabolism protein [Halalkaliarchaeum desulfuricum]AUX10118.1 tRNA 2-thiouridine synthesizing protein B [Halalkaliarchaeum desulfuricum]
MIYLVDKPSAEVAFRTAQGNQEVTLVLIQDGVLLEPGESVPAVDVPVYAVERDVEVRGVDLPPEIEPITYDRLMRLVIEDGVKSFV